jgi:hypothetical protein
VRKRLDIESQRGADAEDIFSVELLKNSRLACVIQPAMLRMRGCWARELAHRKRIRISFSFCRFFLMIVKSPIDEIRFGCRGSFLEQVQNNGTRE